MFLYDFLLADPGRFDAVLLDIDGTMLHGPNPVPGAPELLRYLRESGKPFYFLTNDGSRSTERKAELLRRTGVDARPEEVLSCLAVLPRFVDRHGWHGKTFLQVGRIGDVRELVIEPELGNIESCFGVLMGEGPYDWRSYWEKLFDFFLRNPGRPFVVANPDLCWHYAETGELGIGAGGQARCLQLLIEERGGKLDPIYLGKPYPAVYDHAAEQLGVRERDRILCVGDSLASDIRGANNAEMTSALVLTGITTWEQAKASQGEFRPHFIFDSIR